LSLNTKNAIYMETIYMECAKNLSQEDGAFGRRQGSRL
jgi:hypothetical protein